MSGFAAQFYQIEVCDLKEVVEVFEGILIRYERS